MPSNMMVRWGQIGEKLVTLEPLAPIPFKNHNGTLLYSWQIQEFNT